MKKPGLLIAGMLVLIFAFACMAYSESKKEPAKPDAATENSEVTAKIFKPLEASLVECLELTKDPSMEDQEEATVQLMMEVDEEGNISHFSRITYPGSIKVKPCFGEILQKVKFPATGEKSEQVYQFTMDPYLKK